MEEAGGGAVYGLWGRPCRRPKDRTLCEPAQTFLCDTYIWTINKMN